MFCGEYIVKRGRERVGKEGRNVGNLPVCLRLFLPLIRFNFCTSSSHFAVSDSNFTFCL